MSSAVWQLQEAKNRLSELIDRALEEGPQVITRHGKETAVVVPTETFRKMQQPKTSLVDFLRKSPLVGVELDCSRPTGHARDVDL